MSPGASEFRFPVQGRRFWIRCFGIEKSNSKQQLRVGYSQAGPDLGSMANLFCQRFNAGADSASISAAVMWHRTCSMSMGVNMPKKELGGYFINMCNSHMKDRKCHSDGCVHAKWETTSEQADKTRSGSCSCFMRILGTHQITFDLVAWWKCTWRRPSLVPHPTYNIKLLYTCTAWNTRYCKDHLTHKEIWHHGRRWLHLVWPSLSWCGCVDHQAKFDIMAKKQDCTWEYIASSSSGQWTQCCHSAYSPWKITKTSLFFSRICIIVNFLNELLFPCFLYLFFVFSERRL